MDGNTQLLIFTHYGNSEYLEYTLRQATRSNPTMRCVLIGDEKNQTTALAAGWEHIQLKTLKSAKRDEFNARFRWIQGPLHHPVKGGQDWLRYVFERFFCVASFVKQQKAEHFWHFDSDTMILQELSYFTQHILEKRVACTTLCNNSCPSGLITTSFLDSYCDSIVKVFRNEIMLSKMQAEYDSKRPDHAYTEMQAFCDHRDAFKARTLHLACEFIEANVYFDDCICQPHSFETFSTAGGKQSLKALRNQNGTIVARRGKKNISFATVNCSWVPIEVFQWIECIMEGKGSSVPHSLSQHLAVPLSLNILRKCKSFARRFR